MKNFYNQTDYKVIINATNIGSKPSGIGIYTLNILRELSRLKSGIHFIVYLNKSCHAEIQQIKFPANFTLKWVTCFVSPDLKFKGHLLRLLYSNLLSFKHRKRLMFTTSQLEVCFFRSYQVITIHDIIPLLFKEYHQKQYYYFKYMLKFALRSMRQVITASQHTAELLRRVYQLPEKRIRIIPNGIQKFNHTDASRLENLQEQYILYIGRLCPVKNVSMLIKAFALLRSKIPHKLILCGDGEEFLKAEIQKGRLSKSEVEQNRVIVNGHVSNSKLYHLLKGASLFVFPSLYEGFGLPPLEAMACGCPVVASQSACLPEVCGKGAYYVDPYSAEHISQGIYKVLTDQNLRQNLITEGFRRAALFSWETSAKMHLRLVQEIVYGLIPE